MTPLPLHQMISLSNFFNMMPSALVAVVVVFAMVARGVARITKRSRGRE